MKFAFLGYGSDSDWEAKSASDMDAMIDDCFTYDNQLLQEGRLVDGGGALQPAQTAKLLRWQNGSVVITDGPYAETKEQLGGIGVLEADDLQHAVELMSKHPGLLYGATFEIRPIDEESAAQKAAALAAVRGNAPAVDPRSQKFAALGYANETDLASKSPSDVSLMLEQCIAFDGQRIERGQFLSCVALQSARNAKTLRAKGGQIIVTDGPYAETKECLGGLFVVALPDLNAAVALLSQHPALPFGIVIEIRPLDEEVAKRWEAKQQATA